MPVDKVTSEVPNPTEELRSRHVVVIEQLLQRVPAVDGLKVRKSQFAAILGGGIHASKQVLSCFKLFPGPLECFLVDEVAKV